jgi:hypothetical protein
MVSVGRGGQVKAGTTAATRRRSGREGRSGETGSNNLEGEGRGRLREMCKIVRGVDHALEFGQRGDVSEC